LHLYLHIPFCQQACHYCDFHFSTSLKSKSELVDALCQEIELQANYLKNRYLDTIYFGGGTPSLLTHSEFNKIFQTITQFYSFDNNTEITVEANPDDLTRDKLLIFKDLGVNRLSIGIQSFDKNNLQFLNRIHNETEAENCVKFAQDAGFENITIDLIYGISLEGRTLSVAEGWTRDLQKALSLNVPHISAYCLTIEPKTVFGKWEKTKKIQPIDESIASLHFDMLINNLESAGYEQYEISNFARNQQYSRHNTSYWKGHEYLGIGPSAHSYDGVSRQFNISNNAKYIKAIQENKIPFEIEILSLENRVNDYILTSLRTKWGCDLSKIEAMTGNKWQIENGEILNEYLIEKLIKKDNQIITLTQKGKLFADRIASDLFLVD
jgi:oxygen-independent coproporphyrinogen III oxidase